MSVEYVVTVNDGLDDAFDAVVAVLGANLPQVRPAPDGNGLFVPSSDPRWIDFSMEKSADGFFIVSNLNKATSDSVFSLIKAALVNAKVEFSIEEV
jgi:hypothetical protein